MTRQSSTTILIADDQPDVLDALRLLLKGEGYRIRSAASTGEILAAVRERDFDLILMDLNYARDTTSGREGLDLIREILKVDATVPIVGMTAWGTIELAVEAIRRGARDFVQKPWQNERLIAIVRTQVELCRSLRNERRLEAENRLLRAEGCPQLVADSPAMRPVVELITRVAPSDANVLITGEHGTGKEVVARTIHALSSRKDHAMITVNVGGLADGVFESELFGHVRGAFTGASSDRVGRFELADGGTLFLDEIANVPVAQQSKLLRVLECSELERVGSSRTWRVDVRVLSATNASLAAEVSGGRFREDLLFRLNTIEIHLPPLRERSEDIPELAAHFLGIYRNRYGKAVREFDADAVEAMSRHSWPGNVRELDHAVERGVLLARGPSLEAADLGLRTASGGGRFDTMTLDEGERYLIRKALMRHDNNVARAARDLGLSRSALYRRMERHGM